MWNKVLVKPTSLNTKKNTVLTVNHDIGSIIGWKCLSPTETMRLVILDGKMINPLTEKGLKKTSCKRLKTEVFASPHYNIRLYEMQWDGLDKSLFTC